MKRHREGGEQRGKEEEFTAKGERATERGGEGGRERNRQQRKREGAFELPVAVRIFGSPARSPPVEPTSPHTANTDSHRHRGAPADGLAYAHQACGAALKTSQNTRPYMEQTLTLNSVSHDILESSLFCLPALLCCLVMPSSSLTLSSLTPLLFLLWALCGSCCSLTVVSLCGLSEECFDQCQLNSHVLYDTH